MSASSLGTRRKTQMGKLVAPQENSAQAKPIEERQTQKAHFSPDKQFDSIKNELRTKSIEIYKKSTDTYSCYGFSNLSST